MRLRDAPQHMFWQVVYVRAALSALALLFASPIALLLYFGGFRQGEFIAILTICFLCVIAALAYSLIRTEPIIRRQFPGYVAMNIIFMTADLALGTVIIYLTASAAISGEYSIGFANPLNTIIGLCSAFIGMAFLLMAVQLSRHVPNRAVAAGNSAHLPG